MVSAVFRFPYNKADHLVNLDLAFSTLEDKDAIQVPYQSHLVFDLRFQIAPGNTYPKMK